MQALPGGPASSDASNAYSVVELTVTTEQWRHRAGPVIVVCFPDKVSLTDVVDLASWIEYNRDDPSSVEESTEAGVVTISWRFVGSSQRFTQWAADRMVQMDSQLGESLLEKLNAIARKVALGESTAVEQRDWQDVFDVVFPGC